jgi:uncharacterized protein involved in exopolysaccharide biosynthesis
MTQDQSQYNFESTDLIVYLWKRKVPLLLITLAGAVLSTIVSLTITPKFRSTVVLFPASETPVSKSLLQTNFQDRVGILGFGEEEQLERMLQILHSDDIRNNIIDKYNLMEHYEIEAESPYPLTKLYAEYRSNIKFRRTEFNSILIEVMDKDPQMAADIANDIAALIDSTMNRMISDRAIKALDMVEKEYLKLEEDVKRYKDTLASMGRSSMIIYEAQAERVTEAYANAIAEGNFSGARRLLNDTEVLNDISGSFIYYYELLTNESRRLSELNAKYMEAKADAESRLSKVYILDNAYVAEKKAYPKKSVIVMVSTFGTFVLAVILFLFFESFIKKIRKA